MTDSWRNNRDSPEVKNWQTTQNSCWTEETIVMCTGCVFKIVLCHSKAALWPNLILTWKYKHWMMSRSKSVLDVFWKMTRLSQGFTINTEYNIHPGQVMSGWQSSGETFKVSPPTEWRLLLLTAMERIEWDTTDQGERGVSGKCTKTPWVKENVMVDMKLKNEIALLEEKICYFSYSDTGLMCWHLDDAKFSHSPSQLAAEQNQSAVKAAMQDAVCGTFWLIIQRRHSCFLIRVRGTRRFFFRGPLSHSTYWTMQHLH